MIDVVALTAELLAIESPTAGEARIVDHVSRLLVANGWNVTVQEVTPGRGNIWASRAGGGVTLSTHLDTVPPYFPPRLEGDRLWRRITVLPPAAVVRRGVLWIDWAHGLSSLAWYAIQSAVPL